MGRDRMKVWEVLFRRALAILDGAAVPIPEWTFGGGTVLMLRHHHRLSQDVDIFVPEVQYLGHLTPRLNDRVEALTTDYVESNQSLKLVFPEGEIDFIASAPLTMKPYRLEVVLGRDVRLETATEIIAKKVWHRGDLFTGRDVFDLAMVAERDPSSLAEIAPVLRAKRDAILARIDAKGDAMRAAFEQLARLDFTASYDDCVAIVRRVLSTATI